MDKSFYFCIRVLYVPPRIPSENYGYVYGQRTLPEHFFTTAKDEHIGVDVNIINYVAGMSSESLYKLELVSMSLLKWAWTTSYVYKTFRPTSLHLHTEQAKKQQKNS